MSEILDALDTIGPRFRSANGIGVEKAMVPAEEWFALVGAVMVGRTVLLEKIEALERRNRFQREEIGRLRKKCGEECQ